MVKLEKSASFVQMTRAFGKFYPAFRPLIASRLLLLAKNPFDPALKTRQVYTKRYGTMLSSEIKNDIRIIWDFAGSKKTRIRLLAIGSHKEPLKVYSRRGG
ncbi:MAG: hypothetical protein N2691_02595 [Patescibacteria group bacterium]|nr:hypothetical protein [Patescibacteria group bacterium]